MERKKERLLIVFVVCAANPGPTEHGQRRRQGTERAERTVECGGRIDCRQWRPREGGRERRMSDVDGGGVEARKEKKKR